MLFRKPNNTKESQQRGFTLVETLVSILLLLLIVVGPMSIATRGMQSSFFSTERTTAVFLAQEATEHIHGLYYDSVLAAANDPTNKDSWDWYANLNSNCKTSNGCDYNFFSDTYRDCSTISNCNIQKSPDPQTDNVYYGYDAGWPATIYTRVVTVEEMVPGSAVRVDVRVTWGSNLFSSTPEVHLQSWIYDEYDDL